MKKSLISLAFAAILPLCLHANTPSWLRNAAISPDGKSIAFTYKGDIWKVDAAGGNAQRLTTHQALDTYPVWSPDSKSIAFASNRYGSNEIFLMPASGGAPTRLTYSSAAKTPQAFTPDGKYVIFGAQIQDPAESALFPTGFPELYKVPVSGGKVAQVIATPAMRTSFLPDGSGKFVYYDLKSNESEWRKHHTSSAARNIWLYDPATGKHTKIVNHPGEDRDPIATADGMLYFLSERDGGSMNIYKAPISDTSKPEAVTAFKTHPVRFLTRSTDGTLCFTYDGDIYTLAAGKKPAKVAIDLIDEEIDLAYKASLPTPTQYAISPDGKSMAFVARGDIFVTPVDYKTTKQITSTPQAEKYVLWGHDSKSLVYASERDGKSNIYQATLQRADDQDFANATVVCEKALFKADGHERSIPHISPDGKKIAYLLDRRKIAVKELPDGKEKVLTDGSAITRYTGDAQFSWSPDSKWIVMEGVDKQHDPYTDILLINAETGATTNLTNTGYFDESPRWVLDGNAIIYKTDRYGMRNHASWGSMGDVMIVFLNQETYDEFNLNKEDAELAKELKEKDKDSDDADEITINIDLNRLDDRTVRLTPFSSDLHDAIIGDKGANLYFITTGGTSNMLWKLDMRERNVEMSKTIDSKLKQFLITPDSKNYFITGSNAQKFEPAGFKLTPVSYSAVIKIDPYKEREAMYDNMVREEKARFYDAKMHGVDWDNLSKHYRKFLPHISNSADFAEMASELLGELNVSHTGARYRGTSGSSNNESTAQLGLLYDLDYDDKGAKVAEVLKDSPFDIADSKVKAGVIVEKINGEKITPENDLSILLTDMAGKKVLVSLYDSATGDRWEEVVKPISSSAMTQLMYDRWVAARAADVDRMSQGRLGYVHIKGMNDASFRSAYADILGKYNQKEGIVIDIRRNGGGRLHEDLEVFFSGEKYLTQVVRGQDVCDMPSRRWNKPSIMVVNEACYSNAHGSPWVYSHKGIGKIVGMPIPGTMTSVNWVDMQDPTIYYGIPVVGYRTAEGYYLENHELVPDIVVENDPAVIVTGEDQQLRRAVEELLRECAKSAD